MTATTTAETRTAWHLKGKGFEFCNCQAGCTCNFNGFPTSSDGSCKGAVATRITEDGMNSGFSIPGVGEAKGTTLRNPVTNEEHLVSIVLDQGFIWKEGQCGQGTSDVEAEGIHLSFEDSNWIL